MDTRRYYAAVNSSETIFIKHSGSEYIIHGLFVDDMMHIYSCDAIKDEFMQLYSKDFEITGGSQMKYSLGCRWSRPRDRSRFILITTQGGLGWLCGIH